MAICTNTNTSWPEDPLRIYADIGHNDFIYSSRLVECDGGELISLSG